jgi:HEPN domain-containing protein
MGAGAHLWRAVPLMVTGAGLCPPLPATVARSQASKSGGVALGVGHKREDLRARAQANLDDAVLLFENSRFTNSYYLAGYAVELGLKACIAAQVSAETIPDKEFIKKILKHEFGVLVGLAGLAEELKSAQDSDEDFAANWAIASEREPDSRYESIDAVTSQLLIEAISDPESGVLKWIKAHW